MSESGEKTSISGTQTTSQATVTQTPGFHTSASADEGTFGSTPGTLFGTPNTSSQLLFGASNFGSSLSSPFGATTATTTPLLPAPVGTTIKFNPLVGSDTMMKNGVNANISTRHQCITCMKEYESKSLEELRLEDYQNNRKGPTGQVGSVGTVFGSTPGTSLFNPNQNSSVSFNAPNTGGLFRGMNTTATSFGTFQPQQHFLFGQTLEPAFNSPYLFGSTTNQPSLYWIPATTNTLVGRSLGNQSAVCGNTNTGFAFQPTSRASTSLFSCQPSLFNNTSNANTANKTPAFTFGTSEQPSNTLGRGRGRGTSGSLFNCGNNIRNGTSMFGDTNTELGSQFADNRLQTNEQLRASTNQSRIPFHVNERHLSNAIHNQVGYSQAIIERNTFSFKYRKTNRETVANGGENIEQCVICLSEFDDNAELRRLPCMHLFHVECIDRWLRKKMCCPICFVDIEKRFPVSFVF